MCIVCSVSLKNRTSEDRRRGFRAKLHLHQMKVMSLRNGGGITHLAPQLMYLLFTKASSEWSRWKGVYQIAILKEVFNEKWLRYAKLHKSTYIIGHVLTSSESALQHYLNTVEKGEFWYVLQKAWKLFLKTTCRNYKTACLREFSLNWGINVVTTNWF